MWSLCRRKTSPPRDGSGPALAGEEALNGGKGDWAAGEWWELMDSDRNGADGDCPEEEIDCRCAKIAPGSDSFVAERTSSSNCVIDGSLVMLLMTVEAASGSMVASSPNGP
jgi:hypothetical protein